MYVLGPIAVPDDTAGCHGYPVWNNKQTNKRRGCVTESPTRSQPAWNIHVNKNLLQDFTSHGIVIRLSTSRDDDRVTHIPTEKTIWDPEVEPKT